MYERGGQETGRVEAKKDGTKHLVIPASLTSMGRVAFKNKGLTSMSIPNSVNSIDKTAFAGNSALKTVTITGRGTIANNAFSGRFDDSGSSAIALIIEHSITSIGWEAFKGNKLTEAILPKALYDNKGNAVGANATAIAFYEYNSGNNGQKGNPIAYLDVNWCRAQEAGNPKRRDDCHAKRWFNNYDQAERHKAFGDCKRREDDWAVGVPKQQADFGCDSRFGDLDWRLCVFLGGGLLWVPRQPTERSDTSRSVVQGAG